MARAIDLADRFENMRAQMVKQLAARTSDVTGDGTTTATLLARSIFTEGIKMVAAGHDPMALKRGIDRAVDAVVAALGKLSKPSRDRREIAQVGTISANNDSTVGKIIAEAMERVGKEGVITVEEARGLETTLEVVEGMQLDRGYLSPDFVTNPERMEVRLDDAFVAISAQKISAVREVLPVLEQIAKSRKPLLIVAEDIDGDALTTLAVNKLRGTISCVAVRAPDFGDWRKSMLEDIAILTGGRLMVDELGLKLENVGLQDLGRAKQILVDKDATTIMEDAGKETDLEARIRQLRAHLEEADSEYDRERLRGRLAKLAGGVAVIKVGAATEFEMKERKARVDDALHATRAAVEEGVVPGGGVALIRAVMALQTPRARDDEKAGIAIVRRALEEPARWIAANAGWQGSIVVNKIRANAGAFGFNGRTEEFEDLIKVGVIDPTKVVRSALQNAASVASLLLTTELHGRGGGGAQRCAGRRLEHCVV